MKVRITAIVLPMILFGGVIWQDYRSVVHSSERQLDTSRVAFQEHANRVFETYRLALEMIDSHIAGMSWDAINTSEELYNYLNSLTREYSQIMSIWLVDRNGQVRNSSYYPLPVPTVNVPDREYFSKLKGGNLFFVGPVITAKVTNQRVFNVAIRRSTPSGEFDGVIAVSAAPSYFTDFWQLGEGSVAAMTWGDGYVLVRQPPTDKQLLPSASNAMKAMAKAETGEYSGISPIDDRQYLCSYGKINDVPVYINHCLATSAIAALWQKHVLNYGLLFVPVFAGLAGLAIVAQRRAKLLQDELQYRVIVESQLRQAQKLEIVGQLSSGMAHDFRHLLTIIIGSLEMVMAGASDIKKHVARAFGAAQRGADAIESTMRFVREGSIDVSIIDLNEIIGMPMLCQALGANITLKLFPAPIPCIVRVDRAQLEMTILNIALNARDAMPTGGELVVMTNYDEHHAIVSIRDTGTGMSPEIVEQALTPLFTTKQDKGSGLGLSMVNNFARQSHGHVVIDSVVGGGTTVSIMLPRIIADQDDL